jgi:sugar phosphate isomerase/epimerase
MLVAYCTNIHPAESWSETFAALKKHALNVRDCLGSNDALLSPFPLAPRLSARAAKELLEDDHLQEFIQWVAANDCRVFTINGFPYGAFHGTRVKENVYRPDWTDPERLRYTMDLFRILQPFIAAGEEGSVSTLPGSFKAFAADESLIIKHLLECAEKLEELSIKHACDFHLGLEPEPLGHFENTEETVAFFDRLFAAAKDPQMVRRRIGVNYDTCHFALEFDECFVSLDRLQQAEIRISKVHLSAALAVDPADPLALKALQSFQEPTYLHQVLLRNASTGNITRFTDLPEFFAAGSAAIVGADEARIHFHIPLDVEPELPLHSTRNHAEELLAYRKIHPDFCQHYEIETYTWGVLPSEMQRPIEEQLAAEYRWVLARM